MSNADLLPLLQSISDRLAAIEGTLKSSGLPTSRGGDADAGAAVPRSISAFDTYCAQSVNPFVGVCEKLGGDAAKLGQIIKGAWQEMRAFLLMAATCKKPDQAEMGKLLAGCASKMQEVGAMSKNRNEWEKHVKTCSEGIQALSWLCMSPAPMDYIKSMIDGADYWSNSIRKDHKATVPKSDHIVFVETFKSLLEELIPYVKEFHTTGVTWNPKGVATSEYKVEGGAAAPLAAAVPAATVAAAVAPAAAAAPAAGATKADLFASLSKEGAITAGLKKVTKDQQTWRAEFKSDAPAPVAAAKPKAGPAPTKTKGPARMDFQAGAKKWVLENQSDASGSVTVTIGEKEETVYIMECIKASIIIVGRCKSIIVDTCKQCNIQFDNAFGTFEVINCQRLQVYCKEGVPSIAIDKTDGCCVHLPASALDTTVIVASKSSEMNVSFPDASGEIVEKPIPEQYVHRIKDGNVTADVSDLYSH